MESHSRQTVTVDRISNSGNAIAQQQHAGKTIHVPVKEVGTTHEVRLVDQGSHFTAEIVDSASQIQPRQPSATPDTSDVGADLLEPERNQSHTYEIRSSVPGSRRDKAGEAKRRSLSRRKK